MPNERIVFTKGKFDELKVGSAFPGEREREREYAEGKRRDGRWRE